MTLTCLWVFNTVSIVFIRPRDKLIHASGTGNRLVWEPPAAYDGNGKNQAHKTDNGAIFCLILDLNTSLLLHPAWRAGVGIRDENISIMQMAISALFAVKLIFCFEMYSVSLFKLWLILDKYLFCFQGSVHLQKKYFIKLVEKWVCAIMLAR